MDTTELLARIGSNAAAKGFSQIEEPGFDAVFHRRKFMLTRFSLVDAVITVRLHTESATAADLAQAGEDAFAVAKANKSFLPRGLGGALEIFPISFAATAGPEAVEYARATSKNRWGAFTMHALIHGDPPTAVIFDGHKLWGGAYTKGLKKSLTEIIS